MLLIGKKSQVFYKASGNMRIASNSIVSLFMTAIIIFILPIAIVGFMLGSVLIVSLIPGFMELGSQSVDSILQFLAVFGSGKPVAGMITLSLAGSFVGILFDLFNIYRFQSLR